MKLIGFLAFVLLSGTALAQPSGGSTGRVYTGDEPFDLDPQMTYGTLSNGVIKVKSGESFSYQLYIGDRDKYKFYFIENGVYGSEVKTFEDTYVKFLKISIQSSLNLAGPSANHDGDAARYTLTYAGQAVDVTEKVLRTDTFKPTNADCPEPSLRDPTNANDIVQIFFEISPR